MILDEYSSLNALEKKSNIQRIIDVAVNDRIIPQLNGFDYLKLKKFNNYVNEELLYLWLEKSKRTLKSLV